MNNIDAIFLDLDGTTLNREKHVSYSNKTIIQKALDCGIDVFLVSGRPLFFVKQIASEIDKRCQIVGFNGAYFTVNGTEFKSPIKRKELDFLMDRIKYYNIEKYYIKGLSTLYCSDDDNRFTYSDLQRQGLINVHLNVNKLDNETESIYKILIIDSNDKKLELFAKDCAQCLSVTSSHPRSLDIMEKTVDKGSAIDTIIRLKGYDKSRLMAIGDGLNDLAMLNRTAFSVAMENGNQVLKEKAFYVTKSNENDGVAYAIQKFCFESVE